MNPSLVPSMEPIPIPAPAGIFHGLLIFTFFLHAIFVNLTLGGTLIAAFSQLFSGGRAGDHRTLLAQRLMSINTFAISLAITTGVAPLLFVQVLYNRYFYSATILLGWLWFSVVVLVLVGYYSAYLYKYRGAPEQGAGGTTWLFVSSLTFFAIAMVHVATNLLHSQPELWQRVAIDPLVIFSDRTYFARLFHFVFASLGFSALVAAFWSARRVAKGADPAVEGRIASLCWRWAMITTLAQILDGFLLLGLLPRPVLEAFMRGGLATLAPLGVAVLFSLGLLMMLSTVRNPLERPGMITGVLALMTATIAVMSVTRHQVRDLYLAPYADAETAVVVSQWGNMALFALLLVAGLATVAYMVLQISRHKATDSDAA